VDRVTIVSDVAADRYVRDGLIPRALLRIIPNGVDVEAFQNVPAKTRAVLRDGLGLGDAFVWLAVGRFEAPKDYPTMLEGFARVRAQHSNTVLLVVGTGLLEQETALAARRLGLADAVRFLGTRRDIPELMSAADAYLMSSAWEGLPVVLLEAAAAALPIVTTAVGGTREVVLDRESGLLVPPRDPEGLAAAMRAIMELPHAQRNAMGERGRRHVRDRFGMVKIAADWEALYRELLASKGMPDAVPVAPPSPASLPDAGSSARERG
jgi:glycosyltransferase involved in cell wall biosynthesis